MDLEEWLEDGGPAVVQRDGVSHWLIRQVEDEPGKPTRFIASTSDPDRMRDVVEQRWVLGPYKRNPVILADHDPRYVVGVSVKTAVESDQLTIAVKWDDSDPAINPLAALIAHQHREGFRRAVSVGFVPGEAVSRVDLPEKHPAKVGPDTDRWKAGYLYRKPELLEVSSVAIPANPQALQLSARVRETEDESEQIRRALAEGLDAKIRSIVLDAIQRDRSVRNAVLALARGTVYDDRNPWAGFFTSPKE